MKMTNRCILWLPLVALAALVGLGCQTTQHDQIKDNVAMAPPAVERPQFIFHKVMAGETMATIARWYSGKESKWEEIAEHNPDLSPFKLRKDDIVKVPIYMATVHSEQPSYSTAQKKGKKAPRGQESGSQSDGSSPPDGVFGPR
jgi:hypothetical protein